jgi:hypothetical protein
MFRSGKIFSFVFGVIGSLMVSKSEQVHQWGSAVWFHMQEEARINDSIERASLAERIRAEALVRAGQERPLNDLQSQIDALQDEIMTARSKGQDVRGLEAAQERLEAQKSELQRRL